jgi:lysophospholipase L1-like esterase
MKPVQILNFLFTVFVFLLVIMLIMPKEGIEISENLKFNFPTAERFFSTDKNEKKDISFLLTDNKLNGIEQNAEKKPNINADSLRKIFLKIQYHNPSANTLENIFNKLKKAKEEGRKVRIMHYGDSQIEGDRITGYFRNELQKVFGGEGPGFFPIIPVSPRYWANNTYSENWRRYTAFGKPDTTVPHKNYGAFLSFCRFAPYSNDSIINDTAFHRAWINIETSKRAYSKIGIFQELSIFYGNCLHPVRISISDGENLIKKDTLHPSSGPAVYKCKLYENSGSLNISFKSLTSPDILGISINSESGVVADNIPIRGGSGTEFSKTNKQHLEQMIGLLQPDLFILQFGGNVLPYIESPEQCKYYGSWFERHIKILKSMAPGADIIVIGPADMSVKDGLDYISHPFVEHVRDAVRQAAFNAGGAFWDMYEAMGGKNSMPVWVEMDPPMAAKDYIHFSPQGASKMAGWFSEAFINDYNKWKLQQDQKFRLAKNQNDKSAKH